MQRVDVARPWVVVGGARKIFALLARADAKGAPSGVVNLSVVVGRDGREDVDHVEERLRSQSREADEPDRRSRHEGD